MSRRLLVLAAMVACCVVPAGALDLSGAWEYAFTSTGTTRPSTDSWRAVTLPADLTRLAEAPEGYFWLRKTLAFPLGEQALVLPSTLILDAVYLDDTLITGGAADPAGGAADVFSARGYRLPGREGQATLVLRLAHFGKSWLRGSPALVPVALIEREILLRNLVPVYLQGAAALALFFTFIPCLALYRHTRAPRLLFLIGATLTAAVQAATPGLLAPLLPLPTALAVGHAASMATLAFLMLFVGQVSSKLRLSLAAAAVLLVYGLLAFAVRDLSNLQWLLGTRELSIGFGLLAAVYLAVGTLRQSKGPVAPLVLLVVLLVLDLALALGARFMGRFGLAPSGITSSGISIFVLYVFLSEISVLRVLNEKTVQELTERVQTGREIIRKMREGKVRLESRNVEMTRNASRLLENAQRQALTIGQIMVSIAEVGTAEGKVTAKERQIHSQTVDTEKMITDFDRQMRSTLQGLEDLARKSETIKKAVAQIIEIADKTNMLSLNASIEATKAGAAGMGFGVVAQEIRKLADTTRSVSDHVNSVIGETNKGVANGVQMVSALGRGFGEIMTRSAAIRRMIEENSRALDEVARSHREIEDGLAGVDLTINSILEVSRDLREMTDRVASTFSWFGEIFDLSGEKDEPPQPDVPGAQADPRDPEQKPLASSPAARPDEGIEELESVDEPAALR